MENFDTKYKECCNAVTDELKNALMSIFKQEKRIDALEEKLMEVTTCLQ